MDGIVQVIALRCIVYSLPSPKAPPIQFSKVPATTPLARLHALFPAIVRIPYFPCPLSGVEKKEKGHRLAQSVIAEGNVDRIVLDRISIVADLQRRDRRSPLNQG